MYFLLLALWSALHAFWSRIIIYSYTNSLLEWTASFINQFSSLDRHQVNGLKWLAAKNNLNELWFLNIADFILFFTFKVLYLGLVLSFVLFLLMGIQVLTLSVLDGFKPFNSYFKNFDFKSVWWVVIHLILFKIIVALVDFIDPNHRFVKILARNILYFVKDIVYEDAALPEVLLLFRLIWGPENFILVIGCIFIFFVLWVWYTFRNWYNK